MPIVPHSPQTVTFRLAAGHSAERTITFYFPTKASVATGLMKLAILRDTSGGLFHVKAVRIYEVVPGTEHLRHPDLELVDETDGTAPFSVMPRDLVEVDVSFAPPQGGPQVTHNRAMLWLKPEPRVTGVRWTATVPLVGEVGREGPVVRTPWAVLLCKFSDDRRPDALPREYYDDIFTNAASGSMSLVDFFRVYSHGLLDLSDSRVFPVPDATNKGWYTLDHTEAEYAANNDLVFQWAREKAVADQPTLLADFFGVVVCFNFQGGTQWRSGGPGVIADTEGTFPSVVAQEMGHGYGLDHSRMDGSGADYQDRWDVMSTLSSCFMAVHPRWSRLTSPGRKPMYIGPGLNAANMASRGWLDESRVWSSRAPVFGSVVELRPLARYDLPGLLAARVGEFFVELRVREGWDAAIPPPAVLIHRFEANHSYIMSDADGQQEFVKGSVLQRGDPGDPLAEWVRIDVLDIAPAQHTATISIVHRPGFVGRPPGGRGSGNLPSRVDDGQGDIILAGRGPVYIPDRSPAHQILRQVAALQESYTVADSTARESMRHLALNAIAALAKSQLGSVRTTRRPAPGVHDHAYGTGHHQRPDSPGDGLG